MSQSSQDAAGEQGGSGKIVELEEDERYRLLDSARRRHAIAVLAAEDAPLTADELAASVARREGGAEAPEPNGVERLRIELHHNHLPRMDDLELLDYDRDQRRVVGCQIPPELPPA